MYVAMHGPRTQVTLRDLCGSLDLLSAKTGPPNIGYHGEDGYCRNTPDLRGQQSDFDDKGNAWLYIEYIDCINNRCFTRTPPTYFTEEISKQTTVPPLATLKLYRLTKLS